MKQNITSNGLLGLPHYRNSRVSMSLAEPLYKNLFTMQITLPQAIGADAQSTNLLLEEVTSVTGLNTNKVPGAVEQKYKYASRSFAGGKPNETTIDLTVNFNLNLTYDGEDGTPSNFAVKMLRKWTDLIFDPITGRTGLKKDYVADQAVITMQDRAGTPFWQWICYDIFPTKGIDDVGLTYDTPDLVAVQGLTFRCDYYDEIQL